MRSRGEGLEAVLLVLLSGLVQQVYTESFVALRDPPPSLIVQLVLSAFMNDAIFCSLQVFAQTCSVGGSVWQ